MKLCFLTGGSGTLGKEVMSALQKLGYKVVNIGRQQDLDCDRIQCDFNSIDDLILSKQINEFVNRYEDIDTIDFVHTAGVYEKEGFDIQNNVAILNKSFNVNALSFYHIVNVLSNVWKDKNVAGSVVAVSSNLTAQRNKWTTAYISSKTALEGMIVSFAQTFGQYNVRFNTVSPGMFPSTLNGFSVPDRFKANAPLGRICEVDEISDTILYLLSDSARSITAQNIVIDGGNSNGY